MTSLHIGENPQLKLTVKDTTSMPLRSTGNDSTQQLTPSAGDYANLKNKPKIGGVTLIGDKSISDLGGASQNYVSTQIHQRSREYFQTEFGKIIPQFNSTVVYQEGDLCSYLDVDLIYPSTNFRPSEFYRRKSWGADTPVAESFNKNHWENVTLDELIGECYRKPSSGIPATDIAEGVIPDVTGKADKVSSPTENNFAALDANGNLKDSGHKHGDYLTEHQDISGKVDKAASDQWVNGGGSSTQLGVACATSNMYAFIRADGEGGNVHLRNGSNTVEFDSQPLNDGGTGAARIFVKTGANEAKNFYFKQNGNFQDGNGLTLGGLNYSKAEESTSAIVLKGSTSNKNVAKGKFVIWDGSLYVTKAAIANGDTLSTSTNLTAVNDGGFNLLSKAFIVEEYSFDYSGLADGGYKAVSASDLGITAKQGYTLAGFIGYASGSYNIYVYGVMPNTSGTVLSLRNKSGTSVSTTVTCRVVGLWIRNELL